MINKETAPQDSPYFLAFMDLLMKLDDPCMTDPEVWLWICGDQQTDDDQRAHIRTWEFSALYVAHFSEYLLMLVERLENLAVSATRKKAPVYLIFLVKKGARIKSKSIPRRFDIPKITKW